MRVDLGGGGHGLLWLTYYRNTETTPETEDSETPLSPLYCSLVGSAFSQR